MKIRGASTCGLAWDDMPGKLELLQAFSSVRAILFGHPERSEGSRGRHFRGRDDCFLRVTTADRAAQQCRARSFNSARTLASLRMTEKAALRALRMTN
jgi:hypothetical protein